MHFTMVVARPRSRDVIALHPLTSAASEAMRARGARASKSRRWVVVLGAWPAAPNHVGPQT